MKAIGYKACGKAKGKMGRGPFFNLQFAIINLQFAMLGSRALTTGERGV
jgi:hypothetical protein